MNVVPVWLTPRRATIAATAVVGMAYLAALPGPLRLDIDAAALLRVGASLADGTGLHPPGSQSVPPGYPVLVAALDTVGLAMPLVFMVVGMGSLVVALLAARSSLRLDLRLTSGETAVAVLLTLLSVYSIKYALLPLTEMPFFALSALSVLALARARAGGSIVWLLAGAGLAAAACTIRTAGIALGLAVVLAFPTARGRVAAMTVAAVGSLVAVATAPYYVESVIGRWRDDPLSALWQEGFSLLRSTGAVASNVPISAWGGTPARVWTSIAGCAVLALISWSMWARRRSLGPVDGFVAATIMIVLAFPFEHPRFLLPVLPYLIGYGVLAARRQPRPALAYAAAFAAVGLAALAFSTALSYTGDRFPERYASGRLAATYRVAWGLQREGDAKAVDAEVLWALRRYDPDPPGFP